MHGLASLADRLNTLDAYEVRVLKVAIKKHLQEINQWMNYKTVREAIALSGTDRALAWGLALEDMGIHYLPGESEDEFDPDVDADEPVPPATNEASQWQALLKAGEGREAEWSVLRVWVNSNISRPLRDIDLSKVPSVEAIEKLKWVRDDPKNLTEWNVRIDKQKPDDSSGGTFADDGDPVLDLIERLRANTP